MDQPITLRMALTSRGDEIEWITPGRIPGGSGDQLRPVLHLAMTMYGVKVCISPSLPNNEGSCRSIRHVARRRDASSIRSSPSAGGSRMLIGHYLPMLVSAASVRSCRSR